MKKYWVLEKTDDKSKIIIDKETVTLKNGLIERVVACRKGTVSFNREGENSLLSLGGSDIELTLNGREIDFYKEAEFLSAESSDVIPYVDYTSEKGVPFPPKGAGVTLTYKLGDLRAEVIYEIYDGIPVICKRLYIYNESKKAVCVNRYVLDRLAVSEEKYSEMYAETSYNGGCALNTNRTLSVKHDGETFRVTFDMGPDAEIKPGECFTGFRGYELLHTAKYYEQKLIEVKEMYRVICPWVTETPLIFHVLSDDTKKIRKTVDDVAEVGFDAVIQTFLCGIDIESKNKKYIRKHKELYDYAKTKGVKMGGYTLAVVKNYNGSLFGKERNLLQDKHGVIRCLATEWSEKYWKDIFNFYEQTGAEIIEIDGPYHFYPCKGGKTHLHKGVSDSRYWQWKLSTENVFAELRKRNIYVNTPDWMFLNGSNRTGICYEEHAFSQPREEQLVSTRIYNYKGTFCKIPSMAWSFLPIDYYHVKSDEARFSPLKDHLKEYEWSIFQHVMSGVIPCFRGKELYDCEETEAVVKKWTSFYKKYVDTLNGITVHFMPPAMDEQNRKRTTDLDCIFNCNPEGEVRGILAVFNQTDKKIEREIKVPLYYTGLTGLDFIPPVKKGSGITEVKHPVYKPAEEPPFPTAEEKDIGRNNITGFESVPVLKETVEEMKSKGEVLGSVTFNKEEKEKIEVQFDDIGDAHLKVSLEPMSYTYYLIEK